MNAVVKGKGSSLTDAEFEEQLTADMAEMYDKFEDWLYYAFDWGNGELSDYDGPDKWQMDLARSLDRKIQADPDCSIREATASGHGIGKTAMVAWTILWMMSTRPHMSGVVTANTMGQLSTKTWRELALWHKRLINKHWFKWSATKFWHVEHPETWAVHATPNSEHNSEAFAGLHAKYVLMIFDEASAIPDKIFEVAEGAMTTPRAYWLIFGNPTRATGRFRDCFERDNSRWTTRHVDSRTCKMTNKAELDEWIKAYGVDSDFVRVRILGIFPRKGELQFIATDKVERAMLGDIPFEAYSMIPVVIGVDVARYGSDKSVIAVRQGRKLHELRKFVEFNTMQVAAEVVVAMKDYGPVAAIFVDGVGVGGGVVDRLQMLGHPVIECNGGAAALDDTKFHNATAEWWYRMREWIDGADLPARDNDLRIALIGRTYTYDERERIRMERKSDMIKRGLSSPDEADAIAHTFAAELGDLVRNSFDPSVNENSVEAAE